jgi:hypothetical protein
LADNVVDVDAFEVEVVEVGESFEEETKYIVC